MKRNRSFHNDEGGLAIVEATILLPVCILMVVAIYYASIFMCQRANMQANLQNTLIFYKNVQSDMNVSVNSEEKSIYSRETDTDTIAAVASTYGDIQYYFPYRFFSSGYNNATKENFKNCFYTMSGFMFFDKGDSIEFTGPEITNYVIYKSIKATATQTVRPAVSLALIGLPDSFTITVSGTTVMTDADDLIRNIDFAVDILQDTKLGEMAEELAGKIGSLYESFKEKFMPKDNFIGE